MAVKTPLWHASLEPYDPCPVTDAPRGTGRPRSLSLQLCSASELITDQLQTRANHYLQIHHILRKNHCTPITCFSLSLSLLRPCFLLSTFIHPEPTASPRFPSHVPSPGPPPFRSPLLRGLGRSLPWPGPDTPTDRGSGSHRRSTSGAVG